MQLSWELRLQTISRYVCARCWGILIEDGDEIRCADPRCDGQGYVTKKYAERRRQESIMELANARVILPKVFGEKPRPVETILKELGF